ncbi:MAG: hypothetical protein GX224_01875, partial [Thermoplasmatales archaeon]|nr:hypothetical protein [Thermoplasmatales archaeon]
MKYVYTDNAKAAMEKRGLKPADVEKVIAGAGDDRIYNAEEKRFIAKKKIGDLTVYADYTEKGDEIIVNSGFAHAMVIKDIVLEGEDTAWKYCKNGNVIKAGHSNLEYVGAVRSAPSLIDSATGESWFEEYMANGALATAEVLFKQ